MTSVVSLLGLVIGVMIVTTSSSSVVVNGKFTLLEQWKPHYHMLSATQDLSVFTFNETLAATNTTHWQPVCHTVLNASFSVEGWDFLHFAPVEALKDIGTSSFVAGYAEGFLTASNITIALAAAQQPSTAAQQWIDEHLAYMKAQVTIAEVSGFGAHANISTAAGRELKLERQFWRRLHGLLRQMEGMTKGYNDATGNKLVFMDIFNLNFQYELDDVEIRVSDAPPRSPADRGGRHCSGLIRITDDDMYMGHDTWSTYQSMQRRQYKTYQLDTTVAFAGYPGTIASGDDWYITSQKFAVQETTNLVWNTTLTKLYVVPQTASEFLRVMVATYLTTSKEGGAAWVKYFQFNNSGTYNNQWMVVDMGLFTKGGASMAKNGTLFIAEQIPGNVTSGDVTDVLRQQGYWASYNIPFFKNIYELSGYGDAVKREGLIWNHTSYARAEIFRQRAPQVNSLEDMKLLMRYNDYKHDPLSLIPNCSKATNGVCDPAHSAMLTIASRGDLNPYGFESKYGVAYKWLNQRDHGATDSKIALASDLRKGLDGIRMSGIVICGPTHNATYGIKPFRWSATNFSHLKPNSAPDLYDFDWQNYTVPYPPHGYYDGYTRASVIAAVIVAVTFVGAVLVGVVVHRKLATPSEDEYTERVGLAGNKV